MFQFFHSAPSGSRDDWGPGVLSGLWTPDYGYSPGRATKLDLNKLQHIDFSLEGARAEGNPGKTWKRGDQGKLRHLMATEIT